MKNDISDRTDKSGQPLSLTPLARLLKGVTHPEVKRLLKIAYQQRCHVSRTGSGHFRVARGRQQVIMSSSPSDHHSVRNACLQLERLGVDLGRGTKRKRKTAR